jgi:peptidoglycan-N-acetylglucosamine deacetylase
MKIARIPRLIDRVFPDRVWDFSVSEPTIFLTFDDGPQPDVTEWVLDELEKYQAKATFFCVGENVKQYPELFDRIRKQEHAVGNHTMHHLNGWRTKLEDYSSNVQQASEWIPGKLFRPPYGRMTRKQAQALRKLGYDIIMWRFLAFDFNPEMNMVRMAEVYLKKWKSGDIVVLHDSKKSMDQIKVFLPIILKWGKENGVRFEAIPSGVCK